MPDEQLQALERRRPGRRREPVIQTCERCGLVLRHRAPWMQVTFCPRCIHTSHIVALTPLRPEEPLDGATQSR